MRIDVKKHIENVIASINNSVEIISAMPVTLPDGSSGFSIVVSDAKYCQEGFSVTIGSAIYKVVSVIYGDINTCMEKDNDIILLQGTTAIVASEFILYDVKLFRGTAIGMGSELAQEKKQTDKIPMIWMSNLDVAAQKYNDGDGFISHSLALYFLTYSIPEKWFADDAYAKSLMPMKNLIQLFLASLYNYSYNASEDISITEKDFTNFGVYKGTSELWHDKLCGVEITFDISFLTNNNCQ